MDKKPNNFFRLLMPWLVILVIMASAWSLLNPGGSEAVTYDELYAILSDKPVKEMVISPGEYVTSVEGVYEEGRRTITFSSDIPNTEKHMGVLMDTIDEINEDRAKDAKIKYVIEDTSGDGLWTAVLMNIVPLLLTIGLGIFMFTRLSGGAGGNAKAFEFGNSRARLEKDQKTRFKDVAGADEEKEELKEIVEFLKNPRKFVDMGARIPKGVLLVGPPGTGKTLLARAVSGEAGVPFFSISGSEFVEMFVGVGAGRVRDMFKKAKQSAPCIIFIDEIDAVGRQRGAGVGGGHDEREQTLNQLLVEMDGFSGNSGIIVMAATNRADVLDPALLRPGRFDRQIQVSTPDKSARAQILSVHARNKRFAQDVNFDNIARRTPGFSGAQLENTLNEAALLAVRNNRQVITMEDIDEAIDRVIGGPAKKSRKYIERERRLVAYHEAGHAVIGLTKEDAQVVQKVTIIPRGEAGGYNLMTPKEETYFQTKSQLMANIIGYMGGRVAEEVFFGDVTTGAHNDIEQATRIARLMVTQLGMSDLGPIRYEDDPQQVFLGRELGSQSGHSTQVAYEIDQQVRKIIGQCYDEAMQVITENKDRLETIAEALLEYETLAGEEIEYLFKNGEMPVVSGKTDREENASVSNDDTPSGANVEAVIEETTETKDNTPSGSEYPEQVDNPDDDLLDEMK